jgi:hypothetical protein
VRRARRLQVAAAACGRGIGDAGDAIAGLRNCRPAALRLEGGLVPLVEGRVRVGFGRCSWKSIVKPG